VSSVAAVGVLVSFFGIAVVWPGLGIAILSISGSLLYFLCPIYVLSARNLIIPTRSEVP